MRIELIHFQSGSLILIAIISKATTSNSVHIMCNAFHILATNSEPKMPKQLHKRVSSEMTVQIGKIL